MLIRNDCEYSVEKCPLLFVTDGRQVNIGSHSFLWRWFCLTDKVAVFIDNGYLAKVLKLDFGQPRLNYAAFSDMLCGNSERFRTYVYDCPPYQSPDPTDSEKKRKSDSDRFFNALDRLPRFEIRLGKLRRTNSFPSFEQKGVDVLLSVDLVRLSSSNRIDKAILVTGDSDFVPAVRAAKDEGVIVQLHYSIGQNISNELYQICDDRFVITKDIIDKCTMR